MPRLPRLAHNAPVMQAMMTKPIINPQNRHPARWARLLFSSAANLRSGSIFVSPCNNIPAGKAKRKPILAVAVRENVREPLWA